VTAPWAVVASASDFDTDKRASIAAEMRHWLCVGGNGVALVTCHRAELYGFGSIASLTAGEVLVGDQAVIHLVRVACGLESAIVGEDEVLHQVRQALSGPDLRQGADSRLRRLFETAIAAGRRARASRTESSGNLAQKAVAWLREKGDVSGRTIVVAGAGRMGAALARSARRLGAQLIIASRDVTHAMRLAGLHTAPGVDLRAGAELACRSAGVAVALGGPWNELELVAERNLPPIADISAPQAVPDSVRRRMNGSFLGIDDLYRHGGPPPGAYIEDAERLVALKAAEFMAWLERRP
jgi:glutamyl-tRNA reductase